MRHSSKPIILLLPLALPTPLATPTKGRPMSISLILSGPFATEVSSSQKLAERPRKARGERLPKPKPPVSLLNSREGSTGLGRTRTFQRAATTI